MEESRQSVCSYKVALITSSRVIRQITHYKPYHSQENTIKGSIATRRIAFLVAKGYDYKQLTAMRAAVKGAGAMTFIIAPHKGEVTSSTGENVGVDFTYFTSKSTLFDSLFVPGGHDSVQTLMKMGDAIQFINEAYKVDSIVSLLELYSYLISFLFDSTASQSEHQAKVWTC